MIDSIRRLFINLKKSKNLDKLSMDKVLIECMNVGLDVEIIDDKIVFPSEEEEEDIEKLLEVLNGNITKGVTDEDDVLLANTKKRARWQ